MLSTLAPRADSLLLTSAGLLAVGALTAVFGLPLIGWAFFGLGLLVGLMALAAFFATYGERLGKVSKWTLGVLVVGFVLSVLVAAAVIGFYAQSDPGAPALMPYQTVPIGLYAGLVLWVGMILFGLATWGSHVLPTSVGMALVIAGALGIAAELGVLPFWSWTFGVLFASFSLVRIATHLQGEAAGE